MAGAVSLPNAARYLAVCAGGRGILGADSADDLPRHLQKSTDEPIESDKV